LSLFTVAGNNYEISIVLNGFETTVVQF